MNGFNVCTVPGGMQLERLLIDVPDYPELTHKRLGRDYTADGAGVSPDAKASAASKLLKASAIMPADFISRVM